MYDMLTGVWATMPGAMEVARSGHSAAVHGEKLYVIGGWDINNSILKSGEVYVAAFAFLFLV
jgi:hypothetical protein